MFVVRGRVRIQQYSVSVFWFLIVFKCEFDTEIRITYLLTDQLCAGLWLIDMRVSIVVHFNVLM